MTRTKPRAAKKKARTSTKKKAAKKKARKRQVQPRAKPVSLHPLDFDTAMRGFIGAARMGKEKAGIARQSPTCDDVPPPQGDPGRG